MSRVGGRSITLFATCESQHHSQTHKLLVPQCDTTNQTSNSFGRIAHHRNKQTHYRTDHTSTSKQCITLMSERHNTAITPLPLAFGGWLRAGALYHLDITAMPACLRLCSQCSAMFAYCEVANYLQRYVWGSSRFSPRRSERDYVQIEYSLTLQGLQLANYLAGSNCFNLIDLNLSSKDC